MRSIAQFLMPTAILACAFAMAPPAHANLVDLDIDFTDATAGASLMRRGPEFGEPIPGPFDNTSDEIATVGSDKKVQIQDTANPNPEYLYWGFYDDRALDDGQVVIEANFSISDFARASMQVLGDDVSQQVFFELLLEPNGDLTYLDAATPNPTVFDTWIPRNDLLVRLIYDLDAGTYDFVLNGSVIFTGKSYGAAGPIERLALGFGPGATGVSMIQDDLFVYRTSGEVDFLLFAAFNSKPLGPIGTGGAAVNEPVEVFASGADVVLGGFPSRSLQVCDTSTSTEYATFEFLQSEEVTSGNLCVAASLRMGQLDDYVLNIREQGGNTAEFLSLRFLESGNVNLSDATGSLISFTTYSANTRLDIRVGFRMDTGVYYLWIDGELLVKRRSHGVLSRGVGRLLLGTGNDGDSDGCLRMDDLFVVRDEPGATAAPDAASLTLRPSLEAPSPNPFNPATRLRFQLPSDAEASLRLYDAAGRWVATLVDRPLAAGSHSLRWDGRDAAGRPVTSGVYFAQLRAGGHEARQKLVLLK